jgi:hypothetical protein
MSARVFSTGFFRAAVRSAVLAAGAASASPTVPVSICAGKSNDDCVICPKPIASSDATKLSSANRTPAEKLGDLETALGLQFYRSRSHEALLKALTEHAQLLSAGAFVSSNGS